MLGLIPILRAGLGMVDGMLKLLPSAKVGHIGLYRDHDTLKPVEYYCSLPSDVTEREIDRHRSDASHGRLRDRGAGHVEEAGVPPDEADVPDRGAGRSEGGPRAASGHRHLFGRMDEKLNDKGYIVPGLGDAGDRLYGTK